MAKIKKKTEPKRDQKIILYLGPQDLNLASKMKADLENRMSLRISWSMFCKHCFKRLSEIDEKTSAEAV